ncbi:Peroxidasin [Melipona quadrifasciata]|uniref:Peroxidasin n=1 Tax=Melipona quadrifasciata TaxID=166423 RepID=A0A0N0BCF0_9HYME|nr:Peroxidasin [Melipona quadrifasciata]
MVLLDGLYIVFNMAQSFMVWYVFTVILFLLRIQDAHAHYVYGVDHDLQARARAGLEAERFTYQTNARQIKRKLGRLKTHQPKEMVGCSAHPENHKRNYLSIKPGSNDAPCRIKPDRPCPPSKYRTPSGACNNVRHPVWGARGAPFLKLLPSAYSDDMRSSLTIQKTLHVNYSREIGKGVLFASSLISNLTTSVASPRQSVGNHVLPTPTKAVSTLINHLRLSPEAHEGLTSLSGVWSELILRDISSTVHPSSKQNVCCSGKMKHPECYEIRDEQTGTCVEYLRSVPSLTVHRCNFDTREQMNGASSYLDGSHIYGSTDEQLHRVRTYSQGKVDISGCEACNNTEDKTLGMMYSALLNEHNRIADELARANEHWDDTKLFLEARRLVVAQIQHVTLNEYVPSILGEGARTDRELMPVAAGFYNGYSSSNVGGTYDAVALAALRALTSLRKHAVDDATCLEDHIQNFEDLKHFMHPRHVSLLESVYSQVEDIDLLLGGILETPRNGATVGPTFECLLKRQFVKMRNSDRFWYENDIPPSGMTPAQLAEIRKITLAGILCANTKIERIQPKAFIQQDPYLNAKINCDQHSVLDIAPWREEPLPEPAKEVTIGSKSGVIPEFVPELSPSLIAAAVKKAEADLIERKQLEYNSWLQQRIADPKSPAGTAASFSKANRDALLLANSSIMYELATNEILNGIHGLRRRKRQIFDTTDNVLGFPNNDFSDLLQNVDISGFLSQKKPTNHDEVECPVDDSPCDPTSPYRTLSGHCNNLRNPNLGKSLTTFARLLPPVYEDGVSKPRSTSVTGIPLPNPRVISTVIHPDISNLHNRYTLMVMQFAQFLDHDLTMTPIHKGFAESIPSCRSCDSPRTVHPECHPFPVPPGDHYYPTVNVTSGARMCFPSMRSLPGQQHLGPREQINQNTGFLDASVIYGENTCICNILRGFNGRMNSTQNPHRGGKDLLPQSPTHPECKAKSGYCFIGGDGRASEQPALTVMHTMWIREHNRIVESLRQLNPHWDGEKLFQQSRRIISAMLQHITYNEFLPRILGWNAVTLYGLKLLPQGYYKEYSPTCNPSVLTEFATAAYRIGHSLLRPHLPRMDRNYQNMEPSILLRDGFFDPDMLYQKSMMDEMTRGLIATPMETLDQFITGEVTNHLFEIRGIPYSGVDLIALNIHRARDHGIPSYNNYRALCNLKRATTFEDLSREMAPEVIARMKRIYASVDDIDLFPGGMSERPLQGGLVGPTFACIIAIQFRQSRKCDRFWYETDDPNIRFTEHQLAEIRKSTLSKVMCENMDEHNEMQRAAFDLPSNFLNPRVPCSSMPQIDLSAWRETRHGCQITQCASLRITDCNQLLREASREAILRDDVCTAQCGFVLAATEPTSRLQFTTPNSFPGFAQHRNSLRSVPTPVSFNGFKLPDLSQFIG